MSEVLEETAGYTLEVGWAWNRKPVRPVEGCLEPEDGAAGQTGSGLQDRSSLTEGPGAELACRGCEGLV